MSIFYKLRAHHLVCLQSFQGKGYNNEFVKNMKEAVDFLHANPDTPVIEVIDSSDSLCKVCPNNKSGKCKDEENIRLLDENYSKMLKIKQGDKVSLNLIKMAFSKNITYEIFQKICNDCCWKYICENNLNFKN